MTLFVCFPIPPSSTGISPFRHLVTRCTIESGCRGMYAVPMTSHPTTSSLSHKYSMHSAILMTCMWPPSAYFKAPCSFLYTTRTGSSWSNPLTVSQFRSRNRVLLVALFSFLFRNFRPLIPKASIPVFTLTSTWTDTPSYGCLFPESSLPADLQLYSHASCLSSGRAPVGNRDDVLESWASTVDRLTEVHVWCSDCCRIDECESIVRP